MSIGGSQTYRYGDTMAFNPEDNTFVKQSLTDNLTGSSTSSRLVPKPSLTRTRKLLSSKDMASRKAKADDESGGILKTLGLTPSSRKNWQSPQKDVPTDWDHVERFPIHPEAYSNHHPSEPKTPNPPVPLQPDTENTMKGFRIESNPTPSKLQPQTSSDSLTRRHSSQPLNESSIIFNLRRQLAESHKAREELSSKCNKLERELNELKNNENKVKADGKLLGTGEYQELEKQFDEQEKLLSGYQRENERSLIELEATKVKMSKMGNLLSKIYGPEWEDTISSMTESSPGGTLKQNPHRVYSTPLKTTPTIIPNSPSDKLSLQLAQVQLLVQGMERRLVSREAELEDLHKQSKQEHLILQESLSKLVSNPTPRLKSHHE